ncbi:unnamed protein product [Hapterophycus canaliculatus]
METLLRSSADPSVQSWHNRTTLHRATEGTNDDVINLLVRAGVSVAPGPAVFEGPLQIAVDGKAPKAVRTLIRHGAPLDWHEGGLETPLFSAVRQPLPSVVAALPAAGSDPNLHVDEGTILYTLFSEEIGSRFREVFSEILRTR